MRECQDKRVRLRFDDGYECIATLLSATQDMDGSLHLVYDRVEWEAGSRAMTHSQDATFYSLGEALVTIDEMAAKPPA
jgi:hypothetical protein